MELTPFEKARLGRFNQDKFFITIAAAQEYVKLSQEAESMLECPFIDEDGDFAKRLSDEARLTQSRCDEALRIIANMLETEHGISA
jgi:hypothetical protein